MRLGVAPMQLRELPPLPLLKGDESQKLTIVCGQFGETLFMARMLQLPRRIDGEKPRQIDRVTGYGSPLTEQVMDRV